MEYPALVGGFKETRDSHRAPLSSAQAGEINTQHSFGVFLKSPLSHLEKCLKTQIQATGGQCLVQDTGHTSELGLLYFSVEKRKWDPSVLPSLSPPTASAALHDHPARKGAGQGRSSCSPPGCGDGEQCRYLDPCQSF